MKHHNIVRDMLTIFTILERNFVFQKVTETKLKQTLLQKILGEDQS
jgi:hypothetical protein